MRSPESHGSPRADHRTGRLAAWLRIGLAACVLPMALWSVRATALENGPHVSLSSIEIQTGGTLLVQIDCHRMPSSGRVPNVSFGDQVVYLFPHPAQAKGVYAGLVGIPLSARAGPAALRLTDGLSVAVIVFMVRLGKAGAPWRLLAAGLQVG